MAAEALVSQVIYQDRYRDLSVSSLVCSDGTPIGALQISTLKRRVRIQDVVVLSLHEAESVSWAILREIRRRRGESP